MSTPKASAMLVTITWAVPTHVRRAIAQQRRGDDMPAGYVEVDEWIRDQVSDATERLLRQTGAAQSTKTFRIGRRRT